MSVSHSNSLIAMIQIFANSGMSRDNISNTLDVWRTQSKGESFKRNVVLGLNTPYNNLTEDGKEAYDYFKNILNWDIVYNT